MNPSPLFTHQNHGGAVSIRRLGDGDLAAVERLAARDSGPPPAGPLLGAEIEGRLLAATSLATGETVADPFSRTDELRALLELRAAQLRHRTGERRRRRRRLRRSRGRVALAGSPPGVPQWLMAPRPPL